jgi:hypothetical protein
LLVRADIEWQGQKNKRKPKRKSDQETHIDVLSQSDCAGRAFASFSKRTMPTGEPRAACAQENNLVQILTKDVKMASICAPNTNALPCGNRLVSGQRADPVRIFSFIFERNDEVSPRRKAATRPNRSFTIDEIAVWETPPTSTSEPKFVRCRLLLSIP